MSKCLKKWIWALGIIAFLYGWLTIGFRDLLFTLQDHSLFLNSSSFWGECMHRPMGFCIWLGTFFTQFLYYPWLGAGLYIGVWLLVAFLLDRILKLKGYSTLFLLLPVCALLVSVTGLGYWVYCLEVPGYAFSHSLAYAFVLLFAWIGRKSFSSARTAWVFALLFPFAVYPICGWYMLLGTAFLLLLCYRKACRLPLALLLLGTLVAPWCWAQCYTTVPVGSSWWAGFPEFNNTGVANLRPQLPFYLLILSTLLLGCSRFWGRWQEKFSAVPGLVLGVLCAAFVIFFSFRDYNFHREMRMYQAAEEGRWEDVLEEAAPGKAAGTQTVAMLRNVALLNLGKVDEILDYDAWRVPENKKDDMHLDVIQIGIPFLYYQYGQLHHATRWAMELSVKYGYSVATLKTLLRCARLTGEKELEQKYQNLLSQTLFYKGWQEKPASHITTLYQDTPQELTNDANRCEGFLLTHFVVQHGETSELTHRLALWSALMLKNVSYFWGHFNYYRQEGLSAQLPVAALQAAAMFGTLSGHDISELNLPAQIVEQYTAFQKKFTELNAAGNDKQQTALALLPDYGHTYWWYYCFGPDEY